MLLHGAISTTGTSFTQDNQTNDVGNGTGLYEQDTGEIAQPGFTYAGVPTGIYGQPIASQVALAPPSISSFNVNLPAQQAAPVTLVGGISQQAPAPQQQLQQTQISNPYAGSVSNSNASGGASNSSANANVNFYNPANFNPTPFNVTPPASLQQNPLAGPQFTPSQINTIGGNPQAFATPNAPMGSSGVPVMYPPQAPNQPASSPQSTPSLDGGGGASSAPAKEESRTPFMNPAAAQGAAQAMQQGLPENARIASGAIKADSGAIAQNFDKNAKVPQGVAKAAPSYIGGASGGPAFLSPKAMQERAKQRQIQSNGIPQTPEVKQAAAKVAPLKEQIKKEQTFKPVEIKHEKVPQLDTKQFQLTPPPPPVAPSLLPNGQPAPPPSIADRMKQNYQTIQPSLDPTGNKALSPEMAKAVDDLAGTVELVGHIEKQAELAKEYGLEDKPALNPDGSPILDQKGQPVVYPGLRTQAEHNALALEQNLNKITALENANIEQRAAYRAAASTARLMGLPLPKIENVNGDYVPDYASMGKAKADQLLGPQSGGPIQGIANRLTHRPPNGQQWLNRQQIEDNWAAHFQREFENTKAREFSQLQAIHQDTLNEARLTNTALTERAKSLNTSLKQADTALKDYDKDQTNKVKDQLMHQINVMKESGRNDRAALMSAAREAVAQAHNDTLTNIANMTNSTKLATARMNILAKASQINLQAELQSRRLDLQEATVRNVSQLNAVREQALQEGQAIKVANAEEAIRSHLASEAIRMNGSIPQQIRAQAIQIVDEARAKYLQNQMNVNNARTAVYQYRAFLDSGKLTLGAYSYLLKTQALQGVARQADIRNQMETQKMNMTQDREAGRYAIGEQGIRLRAARQQYEMDRDVALQHGQMLQPATVADEANLSGINPTPQQGQAFNVPQSVNSISPQNQARAQAVQNRITQILLDGVGKGLGIDLTNINP